jgi:hypothetical protein
MAPVFGKSIHQMPLIPADVLKKHRVHELVDTRFRSAARLLEETGPNCICDFGNAKSVPVDHTTLFRWVQHYAPLMEKRIRWYQLYTDASWRVDETYVKVAGQWAYLYRAIDKNGETIDFMLSPRRTRTCPYYP